MSNKKVESIPKSRANFLKQIKKFENGENRQYFYNLALRLMKPVESKKKNWFLDKDVIAALLIISYTWNARGIFRMKNKPSEKSVKDLLKKNCELVRELISLPPLSVVNIDEDRECIEKIFKRFKKVFGGVGATKALHLLNRKLIVMWDLEILAGLKTGWLLRSNLKRTTTSSCNYVNFLERMKYFAKYLECREEIKSLLTGRRKKTLAKLIDEYNYACVHL